MNATPRSKIHTGRVCGRGDGWAALPRASGVCQHKPRQHPGFDKNHRSCPLICQSRAGQRACAECPPVFCCARTPPAAPPAPVKRRASDGGRAAVLPWPQPLDHPGRIAAHLRGVCGAPGMWVRRDSGQAPSQADRLRSPGLAPPRRGLPVSGATCVLRWSDQAAPAGQAQRPAASAEPGGLPPAAQPRVLVDHTPAAALPRQLRAPRCTAPRLSPPPRRPPQWRPRPPSRLAG